jgi:hypothetical protein
VGDTEQEAQKRPPYRTTDEATSEKIKGQDAAMEELRERTARLRELRLKNEA